jgi:hypothetical protein
MLFSSEHKIQTPGLPSSVPIFHLQSHAALPQTQVKQMQPTCCVLKDKEAIFQLVYNRVQKNQSFIFSLSLKC